MRLHTYALVQEVEGTIKGKDGEDREGVEKIKLNCHWIKVDH
jgi:hypothetical protein